MSDLEPKSYNMFENRVAFESFGVSISLESDSLDTLTDATQFLRRALVGHMRFVDSAQHARFKFAIKANPDQSFDIFESGAHLRHTPDKNFLFGELSSRVRIKIAEFALDKLFIHAGVVRWKNSGIMFPGNSYDGKTTLIAELVTRGAEYYSDEYAIIDVDGFCHPFPRDLSVRTLKGLFRVPPEDLGATVGKDPTPINYVVFTKYVESARWEPERLSVGNGIMETIPHAISMTSNADFALKLLKSSLAHAIILKGMRYDAKQFAPVLIKFIEDLKDHD